MSERRRFRARYTDDPAVTVGQRVIFPPANVIEDWSMGARCRPERVEAREPRPGDVLRVVEPQPSLGRPWWDVIAEDPPPFRTTVGVILTILGDRTLAPMTDVRALLEHLANRRLRTDEALAAVAVAVEGWLGDRFPALDRAAKYVPAYDDPALYLPWLDGVIAASGYTDGVRVPAAPFRLTGGPPVDPMPETTPNLRVREDATDQLRRHGRAN